MRCWALDLIMDILLRRARYRSTQTHLRKKRVATEAEIGVAWFQAKDPGIPATTR